MLVAIDDNDLYHLRLAASFYLDEEPQTETEKRLRPKIEAALEATKQMKLQAVLEKNEL
jgi:hypothetical protein